MAYVSFKNNLFGITFFYIFVFATLQIYGFISWKDKLDKEKNVKVRGFTLKNSIIITLFCILGSVILGYLLSLIPTQNLAFLDALSNSINLCGVVLMILRFKECWWVWLFNNIVDTVIWIILFIKGGEGTFMMLITSICFLTLNVYGLIKWEISSKKS